MRLPIAEDFGAFEQEHQQVWSANLAFIAVSTSMSGTLCHGGGGCLSRHRSSYLSNNTIESGSLSAPQFQLGIASKVQKSPVIGGKTVSREILLAAGLFSQFGQFLYFNLRYCVWNGLWGSGLK